MSHEAASPALDLILQIGRALDWLALEGRPLGRQSWPSADSQGAAAWRLAVMESETLLRMRSELTERAMSGQLSFTDLRQALSAPELFARCYRQWIVQGIDTLDAQLAEIDAYRWPDDEFGGIAEALSALLVQASGATIALR